MNDYPTRPSLVSFRAGRILVVDEDPRTLRFVRDALTGAGYAPLVVGEPIFQLYIPEVDRMPKFFESGTLHPFDLPVKMRCPRSDRPELDAPLAQAILHPIEKESLASVRMDALNEEAHLFNHLFEERQRRSSGFPREHPDDSVS